MSTRKDRRSHLGSEEGQGFRSPGAGCLVLPIFGSNFEGHRIKNKAVHTVPGVREGRLIGFAGESNFGWGSHVDGTVDCLDTRPMKYWTMGVDRDDWETLWHAEATGTELDVGSGDGYRMLIDRIVVNLQIQFLGVTFIPDPRAWALMVPGGSGPLEQVFGTLVPRPAYDEYGAGVRAALFRRTAKERKRCL